jgi:hypothetical protein
VRIASTTMNKFKLLSSLSFLLLFLGNTFAQPVFWSDTFDAPSGGANNNNAGANWQLNQGGFGGNQWFINGSNTNCQGANMLHISCSDFLCMILGGPTDAIYNASDASERSAVSPAISTIGQTNMTLRFFWVCNGEPGDDFGTISFSADDGANWEEDVFTYQGTTSCGEAVIPINPVYENLNNFRIKFNWVNSGNNAGQDFSFNVDDMRITADEASSSTITTGNVLPGPYCPGQEVIVPFTVNGTFNPGNVFTAQLSNAAGTFTAPVNIGTLNGTTNGSITATIPLGTAPGMNYFIRVVSNNPNVTGSVTLIPIEVSNGPTASIDAGSGTTACAGSGTTLVYDGSLGTLQWSSSTDGTTFSPVAGGTNTVLNTPPINQTTFYQVTVTNDCGTSTSATWTVELTDEVEIPLTLSPNTNNLCNGPITVSITGTFTGLNWSSGQTSTAIVVTEPGDISVVGQDPSGCPAASGVISIIETVPPPLTTLPESPVTLCGASATITASAGFAAYAWSNGQMGNTVVVNNAGIITLTATDNNGCIVTTGPIDIVIGSSVSIPVEPSIAAICDGIPAQLSAGAGFSNYVWSNGANGQTTTVSNTGFYSVTATDDNGCPGSSPLIEVIQSQFPIANFSYVQNEGGYTINFDNLSQNALDYEWVFDSVGTSPLTDPSFTFPDFGPYTITLIIENPCGRDTIDKLIVVSPVGIDDLNNFKQFSIYPNPANDIITLTGVLLKKQNLNISFYDISGRTVLNKSFISDKFFTQKINIENLNKGIYLVNIQSDNSQTEFKLIKY